MNSPPSLASGSVVLVRDEEWLVSQAELAADGQVVRVRGLSELVRGTSATFHRALDEITPLNPQDADVVADESSHYRRSRLWLEATLRKTSVPLTEPRLSVASGALADPLEYQHTTDRKALSPDNLWPRILLADAVGLGKTLEIGRILSELIRRGRGNRILIVCPRHVLEQMQNEMWSRFAIGFVRLDSVGVQRVKQKIPATRNPFTYFDKVIVSINTLKRDRFARDLRKPRWDAVVIDESHNVTNSETQNNRLARILSPTTDALILASATPHNGREESFAELVRLLEPTDVDPHGELDCEALQRLVVRRHRHSPEVDRVVGRDWAERKPPQNRLIDASPAEDDLAAELSDVWLHPDAGQAPYSGSTAAVPLDARQGLPLLTRGIGGHHFGKARAPRRRRLRRGPRARRAQTTGRTQRGLLRRLHQVRRPPDLFARTGRQKHPAGSQGHRVHQGTAVRGVEALHPHGPARVRLRRQREGAAFLRERSLLYVAASRRAMSWWRRGGRSEPAADEIGAKASGGAVMDSSSEPMGDKEYERDSEAQGDEPASEVTSDTDDAATTTLVEVVPGAVAVFGDLPDGLVPLDVGLVPGLDRERLSVALGSLGNAGTVGGNVANAVSSARGLYRLDGPTRALLNSGGKLAVKDGANLGAVFRNGKIVGQARLIPSGVTAAQTAAAIGPALGMIALQMQLIEISSLVETNIALTKQTLKTIRDEQWSELTGLVKSIDRAIK